MAHGEPPAWLQRLQNQAASLQAELKEIAPASKPAGLVDHPDVLSGTFLEQRAFIEDASMLKGAFCTRRSAKSYSIGLDFINDSFDYPYASYVIVGLNKADTKKNYWKDILKDIDRRYQLGAKFNETSLSMTMKNGAVIYITGADASTEEQNKLLGGKNRKVAVDEAQAFGIDLRYLIYGTILPSVADLNGQVIIAGTPGPLTGTFFYDVTKNCKAGSLSPPGMREPNWSLHTWTWEQNPYTAQQIRAQIDTLRSGMPRLELVPWFRMHYLGEWVIDLENKVYKFDPAVNSWNGVLPSLANTMVGRWHYVLAIDLGYLPDPSAWAVLTYHDNWPELFVIETFKKWKMDITAVAEKTKEYQQRFRLDSIRIDGANKQAVVEMQKRHNLPLIATDKQGKSDFIEIMNADFILGRIKVDLSKCCGGELNHGKEGKGIAAHETLALVDEYAGLIWDDRHPKDGKPFKREEHPLCPNHIADAVLYGWRYAYNYLSKVIEKPPEPNTPAFFQAEVNKMWDKDLEEVEERLRLEKELKYHGNSGFPDPNDLEPWANS